MRASLVGLATLTSLVLASGDVRAFDPNQAGKCILGNGALSAIEQSLKNDAGLTGNLSVDVIVIHSVANPNEGQPIGGNTYTGPIVCTFNGTTSNYDIKDAPQDANTKLPASGNIDILGTEVTTAIQYRDPSVIQQPPNGGIIKKLMCLTTDNSNNCFIVAPPGQAVP